jgi:hypothetical protein
VPDIEDERDCGLRRRTFPLAVSLCEASTPRPLALSMHADGGMSAARSASLACAFACQQQSGAPVPHYRLARQALGRERRRGYCLCDIPGAMSAFSPGVDAFIEFVRTGAVQDLRVGATQAQVRATLGEPDDTSAITPTIWKYATTEITFRDGAVVVLAVSAEADADAVRQRLHDEGLSYQPDEDLTYDAQEAFVIRRSNVTVTLDLERPLVRAFAR